MQLSLLKFKYSFEFVENGSTDGFMDFDAVEEFEEFLAKHHGENQALED